MSKISELSDGGSLLPTDYLIAVRSGGNVKVQADTINVDQIDLGDNEKIRLGNSQDLEIFHNATDSIINDNGTGSLKLQQGGSTKLEVTTTGIDVTGTLTVDGQFEIFGTSDAFGSTASSAYILKTGSLGTAPFTQTGSLLYQPRTSTTDGRSNHLFYTGDPLALRMNIQPTGDISFYEDTGTTAKLFWDASAESLGIGTSSPSAKIHLDQGASNNGLILDADTAWNSSMYFWNNGSAKWAVRNVGGGADRFSIYSYALASDAVSIDASGNLLVGTTSTSIATTSTETGTQISDGGISIAANNPVAQFNRITSDGIVVNFRKDGTTVGSIGTASSYLTIGSPVGSGGYLLIGNNLVHPATSTGGAKDNAIDIGGSSNRFKDLYLSGGVVLDDNPTAVGGSVTSKTLDDYEEGTWTPAYDTTNSDATVAYQNQRGRYVKIGNFVSITWYLEFGTVTSAGTGSVKVTGVPFQAETNNDSRGVDTFYNIDWDSATYNHPVSYLPSAATSALQFLMTRDSGAWAVASTTNMTVSTNDIISGSMVFRV